VFKICLKKIVQRPANRSIFNFVANLIGYDQLDNLTDKVESSFHKIAKIGKLFAQ